MRREMNTFNGHNIVRMEGKINSVIQKALDSMLIPSFPVYSLSDHYRHLGMDGKPLDKAKEERLSAEERRAEFRADNHRTLRGVLRVLGDGQRYCQGGIEREECGGVLDGSRSSFS